MFCPNPARRSKGLLIGARGGELFLEVLAPMTESFQFGGLIISSRDYLVPIIKKSNTPYCCFYLLN